MRQNLKNEEGFTFLEALLSLVISAMLMLLLTSGLLQSKKIKDLLIEDSQKISDDVSIVTGDRQIEWHLFLNQLEYYLKDSKNPLVSKYTLTVDEWDKENNKYSSVKYLKPVSNVRVFNRSKNNGSQRLLNGVHTLEFKRQEGWLMLKMTFRNNEIYTGRIWIENWLKDE